jgi:hypothetical protein
VITVNELSGIKTAAVNGPIHPPMASVAPTTL